MCTAPSRFGGRIASSIEAFARPSPSDSLRAEGEFVIRASCPCCGSWEARWMPIPSARSSSQCAPVSIPATSSSAVSANLPMRSNEPCSSISRRSTPNRRESWSRIDRAAQARGVRARVAVRVNPNIDAGTHPHISTGLHINKFGVPLETASNLYRRMRAQPGLQPVGIHVHLGSQIVTVEPIQRAAATVVRLAQELRDSGLQLDHIDIGGGLGISYDGSRVPTAAEYAAAVLSIVKPSGLAIVLEPGSYLVGAAGALLARVIDLKDAPGGHHFAVLDAGMTELMRPALYGSFHRIEAVTKRARPGPLPTTSSGPSARARTRSRTTAACRPSRWATCWPSSMPEHTDRRWRRTTTGDHFQPRCLSMAGPPR